MALSITSTLVRAGQLVGANGIVSAVTNAIDVGITTGAASVTVGDTAALVTLPTANTGAPPVSVIRANDEAASGGDVTALSTSAQGTGSDDFVATGAGHDNIFGGAGSDTLHGGDGNDHIYGHGPAGGIDGGDLIFGAGGNDYIQGNAGADTLDGGAGSDRIFGGADADLILGGDGSDTINGNFGNDSMDGGAGNDVLRGGKGEDMIFGGEGADILSGDLGSDTLVGGAGTDVFRYAGNDCSLVDTDLLAGRFETIADFEDGIDRMQLGFRPTEVLHGEAGTASAALVQATLLLGNLLGRSAVAAVQVGQDTLLFYGSGGGVADSAIRLAGVDDARIDTGDFI